MVKDNNFIERDMLIENKSIKRTQIKNKIKTNVFLNEGQRNLYKHGVSYSPAIVYCASNQTENSQPAPIPNVLI